MSKGMGGGGGFPGNMQALLKQAQKMQADLQKAQTAAEDFSAEGSAGGGMVKVVINGKYVVTAITIAPEVLDPANLDGEMLADLIRSATNQALEKVKTHAQDALQKVTGGMNLGGLF